MDEFIGIVKLFGGNFAPQGWMFCQGQLLNINQYMALYSLLGTTYGGNGTTNFGLPDLRGRSAIGIGQGPGLQSYVQGQVGGLEAVTLTSNQMPMHTHTLSANSGAGNTNAPSGSVLAQPNGMTLGGEEVTVNGYLAGSPNAPLNPTSIGAAGGSQPHENRSPYLALNYIICVEGVYPSRS